MIKSQKWGKHAQHVILDKTERNIHAVVINIQLQTPEAEWLCAIHTENGICTNRHGNAIRVER